MKTDQEIIDNAPEGAMVFSDIESVYVKWLKLQTGIYKIPDEKYGILYWDQKFKEWDHTGPIYAAKLLCSSRSLADIERIVELEKGYEELIMAALNAVCKIGGGQVKADLRDAYDKATDHLEALNEPKQ